MQSALGVVVFPLLLWAISERRNAFPFRMGAWTLGIQALCAFTLLRTSVGDAFFKACDGVSDGFSDIAVRSAAVVFGPLAEAVSLERAFGEGHAFIFAVWVGALITVVSACVALLNHWNVLPRLVEALARLLCTSLRVSGSEGLNAAANLFFGHTESVLVVRAYVEGLTRSELMSVQTMGMATLSLGAIPVYARLGDGAGHLMTATILSVLGGLWCSKILVPEVETSTTHAGAKLPRTRTAQSAVEAVCIGAQQGLMLALAVFAMLLAFTALVAIANRGLLFAQSALGVQEAVRMEQVIGWAHAPVAWLTGVPWSDCQKVGGLLGQRTVFNEFLGYLGLAEVRGSLSPRALTLATYALSGFANPASVGMLAAAIGNIAPGRLSEAASLGWRAMAGGLCASYLSASVAGIFL